MQRFYLKDFRFSEEYILKDKDILFQLVKVLRTQLWEEIIFFNWEDLIDYVYKIKLIDKKFIELEFVRNINKVFTDKISLNLYQALPNKLSKLEYIIQKWTEVGYKSFYFFNSDRSQKLNITENKIERLKKVCIEAVEQSWWNTVPNLVFLDKLEIDKNKENIYFDLWGEESIKIANYNLRSDSLNLFVWPEWWWSEKERVFFMENSFEKIYLWERIFRTETVSSVVWFFFLY